MLDKITAAGANGDQPNPSDSAGAAVKEATLTPPRRGVASASSAVKTDFKGGKAK